MALSISDRIKPVLQTGPRWQHILGYSLLAIWAVWWGLSFSLDVPKLTGGQNTYMIHMAWPYLGLDFIHEYSGGATLAGGNNPYTFMPGHPMYKQFTYPPIMLPFFVWCRLFPPETIIQAEAIGARFTQPYPFKAVLIWFFVLCGIFTTATYVVWRERIKLGYGAIAFPFALGLILLSFPVLFAMERGSSDALMLAFILLGVWCLRRREWQWELAAGLCLAIASWMKLYPAFLILALLGLRRWRPAAFMAACIAGIGVVTLPWVLQWVKIVSGRLQAETSAIFYAHSLSAAWNEMWQKTPVAFLSSIPGAVGAGVIILALAAVVSWFVFRSDRRDSLVLPYVLWMTALATYWPLISFDYNLFYLPLATIILWRKRDPMWVHMLLIYYLMWWQPWLILQMPTTGLLFKFFGITAIGLSLIAKTQTPENESVPELSTASLQPQA